MTDCQCKTLAEWLTHANSITLLSGAGVSAESGISTFRDSSDALWSKYDPMEMASPQGFAKDPELVWQWYQWRRQQVLAADPNLAHKAIAKLQMGYQVGLITQNVDGLHQRAGSNQVCELHGQLFANRCNNLACGFTQSSVDIEQPLQKCPQCHTDYLRPAVVWFGEPLDPDVIEQAEQFTLSSDLFISIGTSSEVYPAAGFASIAQSRGAKLVEINPNATPLSSRADLVIAAPAGQTLTTLLELLR